MKILCKSLSIVFSLYQFETRLNHSLQLSSITLLQNFLLRMEKLKTTAEITRAKKCLVCCWEPKHPFKFPIREKVSADYK